MIWALIPGSIKRGLAWLAVAFTALAATWGLAKRDARQKADLDAANGYIKTRARIDHATNDLPSDPDDLRKRMRDRDAGTR